ncbi:MAG: hypothetical protein LKJ44_03775, partial [Bifidobacteriaceae bacterium]|nr:hypothetical protein [Bifidobacteriaceae bacterium]
MTDHEVGENPSYRVEQVEDVSDSVNDDSGTGAQNDDQSSGENSKPSDSEEVTDIPTEPSDPPPSEDDAGDGALQEDEDKEEPTTESNKETDDQKPSADEKQQESEESETDAGDGEIEESSDHRWYAGTDVGTVTINNGGSRSDGGTVSGLDGSIFVAVANDSSSPPVPPTKLTDDLYYCTTGVHDGVSADTPGSCQIKIPLDTYFWIFQFSTPHPWEKVNSLAVGLSGSISTKAYAFRVRTTSDSSSVSLTNASASPHIGSDYSEAVGHWLNIRTNPEFSQRCQQDEPLKIALILDQSSSMDTTEQKQLKSTALSLISEQALGGTDTEVGLYKFGTTA